MGGRPITALAIAGMPADLVDHKTIQAIFRGGAQMCVDAECSLVGGHTIRNPEPIYGLAVTGIVHPERHLANAHAKPGEHLVLTKALGSGIISTAIKRGLCSDALALSASELMATLNKPGATLAERHLIHCCTDITGFGLAGHLIEICNGSGISAEIDTNALPLISPEVTHFIENGCVPGGSLKNLAHASSQTDFAESVTETQKIIYSDAQTSGGLLLSVPDENLSAVMDTLEETEAPCSAIIGKTIERKEKAVYLR